MARQEYCEFETSLYYVVRLCVKQREMGGGGGGRELGGGRRVVK